MQLDNPRASLIQGRYLRTQFGHIDCVDTTPLLQSNPEVVGTMRSAMAAAGTLPALRELCAGGGSLTLSLSLFQRGLDGPGSSQDLPLWQKKMTEAGDCSLDHLPKTPTFASSFALEMKFVVSQGPASGEGEVEYVAPMYGLTEQNKKVWRAADGEGVAASGQLDAPGYVFLSLCGVTGLRVRVEVAAINIMAKEGGMGSSGAFNAGLLLGASMLCGAGLSEGDVLAIGTKLENAEYGGLTGGQQ